MTATDTGQYVRDYYKVSAETGDRIRYTGDREGPKLGTIVGFDGAHLLLLLDGDPFPVPAHPTWEIEYLGPPPVPVLGMYYGISVTYVGDDGAMMAVGHHDTRRVVAAFNRCAREVAGLTNIPDSPSYTYERAVKDVERTWAKRLLLCNACHETRSVANQADAVAVAERMRGEQCPDRLDGHEIDTDAEWFGAWFAHEYEPNTFPVMVWRG